MKNKIAKMAKYVKETLRKEELFTKIYIYSYYIYLQ